MPTPSHLEPSPAGVTDSAASFWPVPRSLMLALAVSALICLALAALTYGSNDVVYFQSYVVKASHEGIDALYRDGANLIAFHPDFVAPMTNPPALLGLLAGIQRFQDLSGLPFRFWFRLLTTIANLVSALLVWRIVSLRAAVAYALCPTAIMIAGFHGHPDPLVVALLLASVYFAERNSAIPAGLLFGIACSIRVWPLFVGLAFLLGMQTWRSRLRFCGSGAVVAAVLALPYAPHLRAAVANILRYHGASGAWGLSQLPFYVPIGVPFTFTAIALSLVYLRRRGARLSFMVGFSMLLFLVLTPGFSVQYLAWLSPFYFLFGNRPAIALYITASVFLAAVYTQWSGGIPWYFADSLIHHSGWLAVGYSAAVCWLTLAISAFLALEGFKPSPPSSNQA